MAQGKHLFRIFAEDTNYAGAGLVDTDVALYRDTAEQAIEFARRNYAHLAAVKRLVAYREEGGRLVREVAA